MKVSYLSSCMAQCTVCRNLLATYKWQETVFHFWWRFLIQFQQDRSFVNVWKGMELWLTKNIHWKPLALAKCFIKIPWPLVNLWSVKRNFGSQARGFSNLIKSIVFVVIILLGLLLRWQRVKSSLTGKAYILEQCALYTYSLVLLHL